MCGCQPINKLRVWHNVQKRLYMSVVMTAERCVMQDTTCMPISLMYMVYDMCNVARRNK